MRLLLIASLTAVLASSPSFADQTGPLDHETVQASAPQATVSWMRYAFKCEEMLCVVRDNPGGIIVAYEWAATEARIRGVRIRIDGFCASACVIFASRVRENVCITPNARIGLHMAHMKQVFDRSGKPVTLDTDIGVKNFENRLNGQM